MGQDEGSGNSDRVVSAPGWSHPRAMRNYLRSIAPDVKRAAVVDRELQKEVERLNAASSDEIAVDGQSVPESAPGLADTRHPTAGRAARVHALPSIEIISMTTNRTGLASVIGALKSDLESAKQESLAAGETLSSAITEAKEAASEVRKVARDIQREAAEAMSALGQISNGGRINKIRHDDQTRAKIQASQLINRLTDHVLGKVEMPASAVTAALGLLKKVMPDLSAAEIKSESTVRYVARVPEKATTPTAWQQKHSPEKTIQ